MTLALEEAKDALLSLFWGCLRATRALEGEKADGAVAYLRALLDALPPVGSLDLSPLCDHLLESGAPREQVVGILLFLEAQSRTLELQLPDAIASLSADARRAAREAINRAFAVEIIADANELGDDPRFDHTPTIELRRLPVLPAGAEMPSLVVLAGRSMGRVIPLDEDRLVFGRAPECDVVLEEEGVSRRHCEVRRVGRTFLLRDLGSKNGVVVNGFGVEEHALEEDDRIQLGSTCVLRFTYQDELEARFQEAMYEAAALDPTTGAYNRRFLMGRLRAECAYARRHGTPVSVLLLDVDRLRKLNDEHGHAAGDVVLREVAAVLHRTLRAEDLLGRYDDAKLAVVLRAIDEAGAARVAERLRAAVEALDVVVEGMRLRVTASVGGVTSERDRLDTPIKLLQAADERLAEAKAAGKNRCVVGGPRAAGGEA